MTNAQILGDQQKSTDLDQVSYSLIYHRNPLFIVLLLLVIQQVLFTPVLQLVNQISSLVLLLLTCSVLWEKISLPEAFQAQLELIT